MTKLSFTSLCICILTLFSCGSTSTNTTYVNPHAEAHLKVHQDYIEKEKLKIEEELQTKENTENKDALGNENFLLKKWRDGINFYAVGNEPFWSLNMDFDEIIRFNSLNGIEINAPAVDPDHAMDANILRYRSITESSEISIQISKSNCEDNMSGEAFKYSVIVDYKSSKDSEYTTFKGCGNYISDPRLYDIWAIQEIGTLKINPNDYKNEFPRLELNTQKETILGHDGCNTFRGSIEVKNGTIIFSKLASTLMACPNMEVGSTITEVISNKKLSYKIENNHLILSDNGMHIMTLKHID